ncbi:hypothetical protein BX616_008001, partial [Lobosporangium transversale]
DEDALAEPLVKRIKPTPQTEPSTLDVSDWDPASMEEDPSTMAILAELASKGEGPSALAAVAELDPSTPVVDDPAEPTEDMVL